MNENILAIFPGAEPYIPTAPSARICILRDILVAYSHDGIAYLEHVDSEGIENDTCYDKPPVDSWPIMDNPQLNDRRYLCTNCGWETSGMETFEVARAHLGKRNPFIQPFNDRL